MRLPPEDAQGAANIGLDKNWLIDVVSSLVTREACMAFEGLTMSTKPPGAISAIHTLGFVIQQIVSKPALCLGLGLASDL